MHIWGRSLSSLCRARSQFFLGSPSLALCSQHRDYVTGPPPLTKNKSKDKNLIKKLQKAISRRERKLEKRRKLSRVTVGAEPVASLPKKEGKSLFIKEHAWKGENWKNDWGEDRLRPSTAHPANGKRRSFKAQQHYPIAYTRRVEGLIEPSGKAILTDLPPVNEQRPVAKLAHGLNRVLFNPGVHWLQDPRSRVYNFNPWLEHIPKVTDFAFERLTGFIRSSRDEELWTLLKRENRMFAGSTSSLTGILSQIYFLISGDKDVDTQTLSRSFWNEPRCFTPGQRMPSSVTFRHNDGTYAIDSDSDKAGQADKNILTWMGTLLEKYLTMSPEDFKSLMRSAPSQDQESDPAKEAFRYAKSEKFVMRSQLDCQDSRLPGTGVFDIKTRACLPIRLDILNFEEHSGYLIRTQYGTIESFEKEYYDLIRSAFLKYSFQVRIGNMDGVFVAYHNTARMFGFQYIPLEEMEERLFGVGRSIGDKVFEGCVRLLEIVCQEIIQCFPGQSVRCTFETKENDNKLNVWVEPAHWDGPRERPIQQLEVRVSNYIGVSEVAGHRAISACDADNAIWSVHWTVSRLSDKDSVLRAALQGAKERQFRAYNFPTGVDASEMPEFWAGLNFSGAEQESEVRYRTEQFRTASATIQRLRELSRAGKEESMRMAVRDAGKVKIVYGQD